MNRTEIAALAREAGLAQVKTGHGLAGFVFRFAALVAAAEREQCAKVCEYLASPSRLSDPSRSWITGTLDCAAAIRARSRA